MVAIVYKRKYDTRGMEHEVLMKLIEAKPLTVVITSTRTN